MGGHYPDSICRHGGKENNFELDAAAICAVIVNWPTPFVFSGFEIGWDVVTRANLLENTSPDNPVGVAYELFSGETGRNNWDLVAVHFAVPGPADVWQVCGPGYSRVYSDGRNRGDPSTDRHHYYLRNTMPKDQIEALLDNLLIRTT